MDSNDHVNGSACCADVINEESTDEQGCADRCSASEECEGWTLETDEGICNLVRWNGGDESVSERDNRISGYNKECTIGMSFFSLVKKY